VSLADTNGLVFTGRLSLAEHPWLAGHVVFDTVILPGAALVELSLAAAQRVELDRIEELTLEAPLALPTKGAVLLQLSVGALDDTGRGPFPLRPRPEQAPPASPWTRHAAGILSAADIRGSAGQAGSAPAPADIRGSAGQAGSAPGPADIRGSAGQ